MKINIEIELTTDGTYGSTLARRVLSMEAGQLPDLGDVVAGMVRSTVKEAEDKKRKEDTKDLVERKPPMIDPAITKQESNAF